MTTEDFKLDLNTGHIPLAHEDDSVAQVTEIERQARAEQITLKEEAGGLDGVCGNSEADLLIDMGLEAIGVKSAATALQFCDERRSDTFETRNAARRTIEDEVGKASRAPGTYTPSIGEDLIARANIATSSLELDPNHVNTDKWGGTDTKIQHVAMAKSLTFGKEQANKQVLDSVYAVRQQHDAVLGRVNQMVPGLSLGSGPSINPKLLLADAEQISDMEDWQRRMAETAGVA